MSKKSTIYNALPIVAAAYGEKFGVKVNLGHDQASTDGQTITIPNVPEDYPNMDAVWGYLAHEAAHIRFSDFDVFKDGCKSELHRSLVNTIEDCRIEIAMPKVYPGTAFTLHEMARYMLQAGHYQPVSQDTNPAHILLAYCLYWLQAKAVGQTVLLDSLNQAKQVFELTFPQGVVVRLNALLRKCADAGSTDDALTLASDIVKMIEEEKENEEQNQQNQQPDQQSQNESGQEGAQQPQGEGDESQDSNQSQNGSGSNNQQSDENQSQQSNSQTGSSSLAQSEPQDYSNLLQQVLDAGKGDNQLPKSAHESLKQEFDQTAKQDGDCHYCTVRTSKDIHNNVEAGQRLSKDVKGTTSKIRQQLFGLVQASQRTAHRNKRSGKRLNTRQLHRLASGDTRIFKQSESKKSPNTAVHILVDMSSSMGHSKANGKQLEDIAREASLAISLALESIPNVNTGVTYFGSDSRNPVYSVVKHGQQVQRNTGKFVFNSRGGTPMAEAIWYSAFELSKTKEERKLMIVLTDGAPQDAPACRSVIELCEASGVEMIGIGIETNAVSRFFENHIVINDATDLQKTLFQLMERSLGVAA